MPSIKLVIVIGQYAHNYYLTDLKKATLTETVKNYHNYLPRYLPLVHPSPRNKIWQKKNPWFEAEVANVVRQTVKNYL